MVDEVVVKKDDDVKLEAVAGSSVLRLTLEGNAMKNMDWFSDSDVFWQMETPIDGADGVTMWQPIYRSDYISDSANPRWPQAEIHIRVQTEEDLHTPITLNFYDWEDSQKHQPMGSVLTSIKQLEAAKQSSKGPNGWDLSKALIPKSKDGEEFGSVVVVDIEVVMRTDGLAPMQPLEVETVLGLTLEGIDMINMDGWFGCSDPYYVIEKPVTEGCSIRWEAFYKSETISDTLNPRWAPAYLDLQKLCRGIIDLPIRIAVYDWEESGEHKAMGHVVTCVRRLMRSVATKKKGSNEWDTSKGLYTRDGTGQEYGKVVIVDAVVVASLVSLLFCNADDECPCVIS